MGNGEGWWLVGHLIKSNVKIICQAMVFRPQILQKDYYQAFYCS